MPIVFDPAAKRIILDSASVTAEQIFSRWEDWALLSDNAKYGAVMTHVGGDDLGGGLFIPNYIFLQNGWRVRPMEANHSLNITGNLFVSGGGVPVVNTLGNYNVAVQYTVPVQAQGIATSGSTGLSAADIAAVWAHVLAAGFSAEQILRILLAGIAGKTQGIGTNTETYLADDGVTPRITATFDAQGNRATVTLNGG